MVAAEIELKDRCEAIAGWLLHELESEPFHIAAPAMAAALGRLLGVAADTPEDMRDYLDHIGGLILTCARAAFSDDSPLQTHRGGGRA